MAQFFFVAAVAAVQLVLNGVLRFFTSKPIHSPGTYPLFAAVGLASLALGVVFAAFN